MRPLAARLAPVLCAAAPLLMIMGRSRPLHGAAADAAASTETARARWEKRASSLLYFDASGSLADEAGLGAWDKAVGGSLEAREVRAGVSPDGRYAWRYESTTLWNKPKTRRVSSRASVVFLGTAGARLWKVDGAAPPEKGAPCVFSEDGETLLISRETAKGQACEARSLLGSKLLETPPFPRLVSMALSPKGRYALVRWADPDKSATHSVFEVRTGMRRDIPSSRFSLEAARVSDKGEVFAGERLVSAPEKAQP